MSTEHPTISENHAAGHHAEQPQLSSCPECVADWAADVAEASKGWVAAATHLAREADPVAVTKFPAPTPADSPKAKRRR